MISIKATFLALIGAFLIALALAAPANAAFSITDLGTSSGVNGTATVTTTADAPPGTGNYIVVLYGEADNIPSTHVASDNAATPNTYSSAGGCGVSGTYWGGAFIAPVTTDLPLGGHITVTLVSYGNAHAFLVTGAATSSPLDGAGACTTQAASTLTLASGSATPVYSGDLAVGLAGCRCTATATQSSGFTTPPSFASNVDTFGLTIAGALTVSGTTAQNYSVAVTSNSNGGASLLFFIKASGAGPPPSTGGLLLRGAGL